MRITMEEINHYQQRMSDILNEIKDKYHLTSTEVAGIAAGNEKIIYDVLKSSEVRCKCCGKTPEMISEYVNSVGKNQTPTDYVKENEGTYNPDTKLFYCTDCYIKVGMPRGRA